MKAVVVMKVGWRKEGAWKDDGGSAKTKLSLNGPGLIVSS